MPNSPKDIQKLIDEVMPQLSNFVAGRRGVGAEDVNYRIALLRDALADPDMDDAERKKFTSQSVHGNNPGGYVFSGIEKAAGLKLSTSLGDVIKRYDDVVLENKPAEEIRSGVGFGIQPAQEFPGEAVPKEVTFSLAERSYLPDYRRRLDQAGILTDSSHRLPKEAARARADALHQELLADDAATKIQAAFRGHKSRTAGSKFSVANPMLSGVAPVVKSREPMSEADKERIARLRDYQTGRNVDLRSISNAGYNPFSEGEVSIGSENPMRSVVAPVVKPREPMSKADKGRTIVLDGYQTGEVVDLRSSHEGYDPFPARRTKKFSQENPMRLSAQKPITESKPESAAATSTSSVSDARGPVDKLAESARALQDRIAGRTGQSAKELQAAVARTIKREAENITPPPPGTKPIGGQSTHRG